MSYNERIYHLFVLITLTGAEYRMTLDDALLATGLSADDYQELIAQ